MKKLVLVFVFLFALISNLFADGLEFNWKDKIGATFIDVSNGDILVGGIISVFGIDKLIYGDIGAITDAKKICPSGGLSLDIHAFCNMMGFTWYLADDLKLGFGVSFVVLDWKIERSFLNVYFGKKL